MTHLERAISDNLFRDYGRLTQAELFEVQSNSEPNDQSDHNCNKSEVLTGWRPPDWVFHLHMLGLGRRLVAGIDSRYEVWYLKGNIRLAAPELVHSLVVDRSAVGWADGYQVLEPGIPMRTSYTVHAEVVVAEHSLDVELTEIE